MGEAALRTAAARTRANAVASHVALLLGFAHQPAAVVTPCADW
jgi:hypothetical protein